MNNVAKKPGANMTSAVWKEQLERVRFYVRQVGRVSGEPTPFDSALSAVLSRLESLEAEREAVFRAGWNAGVERGKKTSGFMRKDDPGPLVAYEQALAAFMAKGVGDDR